MKNYREFIKSIPNLGNRDFAKVKEKVKERITKNSVALFLETPDHKLICPHCKSNQKRKWGIRNQLQRYQCKSCNKTYNSLSKTPLARLRKKHLWLDYSECIKSSETVRNAALICGISKNTSFRWRHKFLINSNFIKAKFLAGIIDIKDIYFKESFKGSRDIPNRERRQVCVINSIDRSNNIIDLTDKWLTLRILNKNIKKIVKEGSIIVYDNNKDVEEFCKVNKIKVKKHIENKPSKTKSYKIESLRKYCNEFENWVFKHFKGVATKYLKNYVAWYRSKNEFKSGIKAITILLRAKSVEKYRYQPLKLTDLISTF